MIKHEQISYTIEEDDFLHFEKNGVICQMRVDAEHLNEGELLMNRFVVGVRQKILQSEEGDLILLDVDRTSYVESGLFADRELLKKKIIRRQQSEFDSQFDRFQIEDFYGERVLKKFAISEKEEMKECLRAHQNMLVPVLVYVIDKSGEKIYYNEYLSMRRDASHIKYDNLLEMIDFK